MPPLLLLLLLLVSVPGAGATCEVDVRVGPGDCVLCNGSALTSVGLAGADTTVAADSVLYTEGGVQVDLLKRVSAWYQSAAQPDFNNGSTATMSSNWVASVANTDIITEAAGVFTIERAGWYRVSALGRADDLTVGADWIRMYIRYDGADEFYSGWDLTGAGIGRCGLSILDVHEFAEGDEVDFTMQRHSSDGTSWARIMSLSFEYLQP